MPKLELKGLMGLRQLDTLLSNANSTTQFKENVLNLSIDSLKPGRYQPRTTINTEELKELANSIRAQGIILPLIVRKLDEKRFEIIAGERRWRAAQLVGLGTVPVIVRDISDDTAVAFGLIENIQRESLNPIDEATAFLRLKEQFCMTHEEIAERIGRSRSSITNSLRLLMLPSLVKDLVQSRKLEMGHARALLALEESSQFEIAQEIISKKLSVRETERFIKNFKKPLKNINNCNLTEKVLQWENFFTNKFLLPVKILVNSEGKGKIIIQVQSIKKINQLIDRIDKN